VLSRGGAGTPADRVKVGSSLVTNEGRGLDVEAIARWAEQIAALRAQASRCVLVSSGPSPRACSGWAGRAAAAKCTSCRPPPRSGRWAWRRPTRAASRVGHAQRAGAADACRPGRPPRYLNARSTLFTLLDLGVVPVINENDTVVTDEIKFGDNDTLGALVPTWSRPTCWSSSPTRRACTRADPRRDPAAHAGREVRPATRSWSDGRRRRQPDRRGGMLTKVLAAKRAARSGATPSSPRAASPTCCCAWPRASDRHAAAGVDRGADRRASSGWPITCRSGAVRVDDGAVRALRAEGKSLLPIGVVEVHRRVPARRRDRLRRPGGREVARGLANYSSATRRGASRGGRAARSISARLRRGARTDPPRQPRRALTAARPPRVGRLKGGIQPRRCRVAVAIDRCGARAPGRDQRCGAPRRNT
jgi:glutamate 5-kinase